MSKKGWVYLTKEPFLCRQVLAAHYVRDCPHVIEIGSYKNPILDFLHGPHESVLCIDPLLEKSEFEYDVKRGGRLITRNALYLREKLENVREIILPSDGRDVGLVALGYDIRPNEADRFIDLVQRSKVAVIECWVEYPKYIKMLERILARTDKHIAIKIGLDLTGNELGDLGNSFPPRFNRELLVLR